MSYHILHQFDEQWLADLTRDSGSTGKGEGLLKSSGGAAGWGRKVSSREVRRWAVVAASLLFAAFALLFALDASRRADYLQQRLDSIETTLRAK